MTRRAGRLVNLLPCVELQTGVVPFLCEERGRSPEPQDDEAGSATLFAIALAACVQDRRGWREPRDSSKRAEQQQPA